MCRRCSLLGGRFGSGHKDRVCRRLSRSGLAVLHVKKKKKTKTEVASLQQDWKETELCEERFLSFYSPECKVDYNFL